MGVALFGSSATLVCLFVCLFVCLLFTDLFVCLFPVCSTGYVQFLDSVQSPMAQLDLLLAQHKAGSSSLSSPPGLDPASHPTPNSLLDDALETQDGVTTGGGGGGVGVGGEVAGRRSRHASGSEGGVASKEDSNSMCVVS